MPNLVLRPWKDLGKFWDLEKTLIGLAPWQGLGHPGGHGMGSSFPKECINRNQCKHEKRPCAYWGIGEYESRKMATQKGKAWSWLFALWWEITRCVFPIIWVGFPCLGGTFWYLLVLLGTVWYLLILLRTCWYFKVLFGTLLLALCWESARRDICHKHHKQRLCKWFQFWVKFLLVKTFLV